MLKAANTIIEMYTISSRPKLLLDGKKKTTFVQFIDNVANGYPYDLPEHFNPQCRYLTFGKPLDFVGRHEQLKTDWPRLLKTAGIKPSHAKLRRRNKSKRRWRAKNILTQEARRKIYPLYEADFDTLEYKRG